MQQQATRQTWIDGGAVVWFCALALPLLVVGIYALITGVVLEPGDLPAFHSEAGPVELVTAALMLVAAIWAGRLAVRVKRLGGPGIWRGWYWLLAAGALFVCLEEISYGQHMMGWEAPEYFQEHNKQREMNVHNLYGDTLSSTMRKAVNAALPIGAILVPLVLMRRRQSYVRGDWTWWSAPRLELAVWVLVAALSTAVRKLGGFTGEGDWRGSLSEFKEMLWACALLMYLGVMWRRMGLANPRAENAGPPPQPADVESGRVTRAT